MKILGKSINRGCLWDTEVVDNGCIKYSLQLEKQKSKGDVEFEKYRNLSKSDRDMNFLD